MSRRVPGTGKRAFLWAVSLVLLIAAVYSPVLRNDFVNFDDDRYVTGNSHVRGGLSAEGARWAATATLTGNWHPLTWLSHMLDVELFGMNPAGHHATNVLLHAVNAVLLFLVLAGMTGAVGRSAFVAALFAVHPLHVESVAWVAERKDVLSTFFWLLALGAYLRYVRKRSAGAYTAVLLAFVAGLMAKPMVVTLPFVLLLLAYWPLGRFSRGGVQGTDGARDSAARDAGRGILLEKVPFLVLAGLSAVATYIAQAQAGTLNLAVQPYPWLRFTNALAAYIGYIAKMFKPTDLAVFYPLPGQPLPWWQALAAGVLLAGCSIAAIRAARRRAYLAVGWFWYLGTLVPVIGLVQVGGQAMADRYTYIPLIGLFVIVSWGGSDLAGRWHQRRAIPAVAAVLAVAALAVGARTQVGYWRDGVTLFGRALQVTSGNWMMHVNLGGEMLERGRFGEAVGHFREAARIAPGNATYHYKLGSALAAWGKLAEAARSYREALRLNPDYLEARNNLGSVLFELGREDEALGQFDQALRIDSGSDLAHHNIAEIRRKQGNYALALEHYRAALRINPDLKEARLGMDIALIQLSREKQRE